MQKKIVIATESKSRKLKVPGLEKVNYFDNKSIFYIPELPQKKSIIGGRPTGIEMTQAIKQGGK